MRLSWHAAVIGMRKDGAAHVFRIPTLFEELVADERMLFRTGKALIVEVVKQAGDAVLVLQLRRLARVESIVAGELLRIRAHACLHGHSMLPQALRLGVLS